MRGFTVMKRWLRLGVVGLAGCQDSCNCDPTDVGSANGSKSSCEQVASRKAALVLEIVSGNGQAGQVAATLPQALIVQLRDATFASVPDVDVIFSVTAGGGQIEGASVLAIPTDARGRATVPSWRLGQSVGANLVRAEVDRQDPDLQPRGKYGAKYDPGNGDIGNVLSVEFAAEATAGPPQLMTVAANPTQGLTGQPATPAPAVRITDFWNNPIAGVAVTFAPLDGGSVTGGAVATDAQGFATVGSWILAPSPVPQRLVATASGSGISGNPLQFTFTPSLAPGARVSAVTSLVVGAQPGAVVVPRPTVKVVDQQNNPIRGLEVTFAAGATGGTVAGGTQTTDADGLASVGEWRAGGNFGRDYALVATVTGSGIANNPVTFVARTPVAGQVLYLAITAGNNQSAVVGTQVPVAPQVRVINQAGNGVAGVVINWSVTQGAGTFVPNTVTTNGQGYATLDYFAPSAVGQIVLLASTTDGRVQPSALGFNLQGLAP